MITYPKIKFFNEISTATTPGTYDSKITNVVPVDGYDFDERFRIIYELTDVEGNKFKFSEIFFNEEKNTRYNKFVNYLSSNGVQLVDYGSFIGVCEKIKIDFRDKYLNIVDRTFVGVSPTSNSASVVVPDENECEADEA